MKTVLAFCLLCTPVSAASYTGAAFFSDETQFAVGFAWGIVAMRAEIAGSESERARQYEILDCLQNGNINASIFHQAVKNQIDRDIALLPLTAALAAYRTVDALCPPGAN